MYVVWIEKKDGPSMHFIRWPIRDQIEIMMKEYVYVCSHIDDPFDITIKTTREGKKKKKASNALPPRFYLPTAMISSQAKVKESSQGLFDAMGDKSIPTYPL